MPSSETLPTGITELTREKHRYNGFVIRAQRRRYSFRKYVSSAALHNRRASAKQRRAHALEQATRNNQDLQTILADKTIWSRKGNLTPKATREINSLGFTIKEKYKQ